MNDASRETLQNIFQGMEAGVAHSETMEHSSFDLNLSMCRTRKQAFLQQMNTVVSWAALVELIAPSYSEGRNGQPPFALETMLRVHFMQEWYSLSDSAMEEAFFDTLLYREFAQLDTFGRLPNENTILRFRRRLEKHKLADQILVTVNELLVQRGLLLKVGTAVAFSLVAAPVVFVVTDWHGAAKCKRLDTEIKTLNMFIDQVKKIMVGIRAKVLRPFRVIKRQLGFTKICLRGLKQNILHLKTQCALCTLWLVQHRPMDVRV